MSKWKFNIFTIFYTITTFLLLIDSYRSGNVTFNFFHLTSTDLEVWSIIILILSRIILNEQLHPLWAKINFYVVLPVTIFLAISLTIWDRFTSPNFVYAKTLIQHPQLFYIAMFSIIAWVLSHKNKWFSKNYTYIIFVGSVVYILSAYMISLFPRDVFAELSKEDHLIENTQVVVLLLGAFWAMRLTKMFYKKSKKNAGLFFVISLALIFIAGEEMSWGQRIFHIATSQAIAVINDQQETTIHNLHFFSKSIRFLYMIIGFYGAFAWIFQFLFPKFKKPPYLYYIPPWFVSVFYFSGFAYNFFTNIVEKFSLHVWSESAELMLYSGMALTMLALIIRLKKNTVKK